MKTSEVQNLKIKGCISLDNLCVMDIKGEDAKVKEFLQGQITSDIQKVGLNTLHLSSICNQKGQIVADFMILRLADGFKVVIDKEKSKSFESELAPYAKFFKVLFKISKQNVIGFVNTSSNASMCFLKTQGLSLSISISEDLVQNTLDHDHWEAANLILKNLLLKQNELGAFRPSDINYDHLRTSFNKGCFRGQEIIARMKYLGKEKSTFKVFVTKKRVDSLFDAKMVNVLREIYVDNIFVYACIIKRDIFDIIKNNKDVYFK